MYRLSATIQNYAWGSLSSLSDFLGKPQGNAPEAELWFGAHPKAPSLLDTGEDLNAAVQADPFALLGSAVSARFGARLPYLLKVLAVDSPLSLQAHPNKQEAELGYERENREGIPLDAPHRTYKDDNHKPELLCALTPFEALCGFRPLSQTRELMAALGPRGAHLDALLASASSEEDALRETFSCLLSLDVAEQELWLSDLSEPLKQAASDMPSYSKSCSWALRLNEKYPGDIGAVAALLLNHIELAPGEAIYLEAGRLHAYLSGMGVELMANSDNVLRGGLTPKHIDVQELLRVLRFSSSAASPTTERRENETTTYVTEAPDFLLSRIDVQQSIAAHEAAGPEILLCASGTTHVSPLGHQSLRLDRGQAAFVAAGESYELGGKGTLFRASVNG